MPEQFERVLPGDIITADFMNRILAALEGLDGRVTELEGPGSEPATTVITALLPSGIKRIGDPLHIIGRGFDAPGGSAVTVDGINIPPTFGDDRDRELVVTVPNVQGVTDAGRSVTVVVTNRRGTDTETFLLFPAVPTTPEGQIFISLLQSPDDPQLNAGASYIFAYNVQVIADPAETYSLSAWTSTGWPAQVVNASGNPILPPQISLPAAPDPPGVTQTVLVRVSIPAGTPGGTESLLRLNVSSLRNPSGLRGDGEDTLTVGAAPPGPSTVAITLAGANRLTPLQPDPSTIGGVVRISPGAGNYRLTFSALIRGNTLYSVEIVPPADSRWTASLMGSSVVTQQNLGPVASDVNQPLSVFLRAQPGAPATDLVLRVTSTTDATQTGQINQPVGLLS